MQGRNRPCSKAEAALPHQAATKKELRFPNLYGNMLEAFSFWLLAFSQENDK
jgi:hypothetical protein